MRDCQREQRSCHHAFAVREARWTWADPETGEGEGLGGAASRWLQSQGDAWFCSHQHRHAALLDLCVPCQRPLQGACTHDAHRPPNSCLLSLCILRALNKGLLFCYHYLKKNHSHNGRRLPAGSHTAKSMSGSEAPSIFLMPSWPDARPDRA